MAVAARPGPPPGVADVKRVPACQYGSEQEPLDCVTQMRAFGQVEFRLGRVGQVGNLPSVWRVGNPPYVGRLLDVHGQQRLRDLFCDPLHIH